MKNYKNESGRSMIEMLGVLAIIGVLSVGGIAGYSKAMHRYRVNKAIEQITLIAGNVRSFFKGNYKEATCLGNDCNSNGCFGGSVISGGPNGCPIIKKAKIVPDEMLTLSDDGTKIMGITNPFGYAVWLYPYHKAISGDNEAFSIHYYIRDNLQACIELLTHDWSTANIKAIFLYNFTSEIYFKTPVSIDLATEKCAEFIDDTTDVNKEKGLPSLRFHFDIDLNSDFWSRYSWRN
ncbi:MAG: hypothetical protein IJ525_02525 [Alphaproteobacteria bacterium]|nr:hypothetical protein [Alphaproteobacteria bacterium]